MTKWIKYILVLLVLASAVKSADTCIVTGCFGNLRGGTVSDVVVSFALPGHVLDTCNNVTLLRIVESTETDDTGCYRIVLIKNSCFTDSIPYEVTAKKIVFGTEYRVRKTYSLYIPADSNTFNISDW